MIYKGSDLIVTNGSFMAASKSCSVDVDVDIIKVSSPTDGAWEHHITGLKSWRITTNHLLLNNAPFDGLIEAQAFANNGANSQKASWVSVNGTKTTVESRGLSILPLAGTAPYAKTGDFITWDTYTVSDTIINDMIDYLTNSPTILFALVSFDAYALPTALATAIAQNMKVDLTGIPSTAGRNALVAIGGRNITKGIVAFSPAVNNIGYMAKTKLYMASGSNVHEAVVKNFLMNVGNSYSMSLQVEGFSQDVLHGVATCKSAKIQATKGNLMTGSFSWEGNGPLA